MYGDANKKICLSERFFGDTHFGLRKIHVLMNFPGWRSF